MRARKLQKADVTRAAFAASSFAELRDRLQARAEALGSSDDIELTHVLRHLTALPDEKHTPDSVDALFYLSRNFYYASQPARTVQAASLAARLAIALEQNHLLCKVRGIQGIALCDLGRFAESAAAFADSWMQARALGDVQREILAIKNVGGLYAAMAQYDVALRYYQRSCAMAVEHQDSHLELGSRVNIANCALQLNDPAAGLLALLPFIAGDPKSKREAATRASAHITLGHLYLMTGEIGDASTHALESGRWAKLARVKRTMQIHKALLALIDVKSGAVESGLAALERGLAFAKRVDHIDVADYLSMCVDAYEAAGRSDEALGYLQELVTWKKNSIDAEMPHYDGLNERFQSRPSTSTFDDNLRARAQLLHADVDKRVQRFLETAVNAEMANGYDLYRAFRVAKLARCLAISLGWDGERLTTLALGAQLSNIGMMAIPTRVLQKRGALSEGERQILRAHPLYGAELLRRSKLRILDVPAVIAEQHQERHDGSGYPAGLGGESIAEEARIVAICDVFDAMTHRRPWRAALSAVAAIDELKRQAGSRFDPHVVDAFVDLFNNELAGRENLDAFLADGADEFEYVRARARMDALLAT